MKKYISIQVLGLIFGLGVAQVQFQVQAQMEVPSDDKFSFETPVLRGTGCPQGTTSVVMAPDQKTLSLLFDRFGAQVPQNRGDNDNDEVSEDNPQREDRRNAQLDHKVCHIVLSAHLPQSFKLDSLEISMDFRGHTFAEKGTRALFKGVFVERRGLGSSEAKKTVLESRLWKGELEAVNEEWTISTTKKINLPSRCARRGDRKVQFQLKNVLRAAIVKRQAANLPSAMITMDSTDMVGAMKFKLNTKPCN